MDTRPVRQFVFDMLHLRDFCWQATNAGAVRSCPGRGLGGKGIAGAGAKGEMSYQGNQGVGKQCPIKGQTKGYVGQQWQMDAGVKDGKRQNGKEKVLANQQWQQPGNANGWGNNQGTKHGSQGTGWQANGGMQGQVQGQPIPGVSLQQQRDAAVGIHPDKSVHKNSN